jgi:hypothetical protein
VNKKLALYSLRMPDASGRLILSDKDQNKNKLWRVNFSENEFKIISSLDGFVIAAPQGSTKDQSNISLIVEKSIPNEPRQLWTKKFEQNGVFLISVFNDQCISVSEGNIISGTSIVLNKLDSSNTTNQLWELL